MSASRTLTCTTKLKELGFDINLTNFYSSDDYDGHMMLCDNPDRSAIPAKYLEVANIDQLKELIGHGDDLVKEAALTSLPHPDELTSKISDPFHPHVCEALNTYLYGNSKTVAAWRDTLNELRFPMNVAFYGAGEVVVTPDKPLRLEGTSKVPIAFVCVKLIIQPGGKVIVKGPGAAQIDEMVYVKAAGVTLNEEPTDWVCIGGDGGEGGSTGNGGDGGNGTKGANATEDGKSGCNGAGQGTKGVDGVDSSAAGRGGDGESPDEFSVNVDKLDGVYTIGSVGGNGGKGGKGGNGGKGGDGGAGGDACRSCGSGKQGDGGKGGNAGAGGDGGDGANGSKVFINYKSGNAKFNISPLKATGGKGGDAGTPGNGGSGTVPGNGGATAKPGNGGKGGQPGKIFINGKQMGS